ncbi:MAG: hypothetical protein NVS9B3_10730 [Gemmatimonadaceae bacterium]
MTGDDARDRAARTPALKTEIGGGDVGVLAAAGLQFALVLVVFAFAGQWLDRRLGTGPWLLTVGILLGGSGSFYGMLRTLTALQKRRDAERTMGSGGG